MVITYYGAFCFKIQSGDTVLAFNPPSKKSSFKAPRFQSDIVLISSNQEDCNGFENIAGKEQGGEPFLINGPGEYEVNKVIIRGISEPYLNTIYRFVFDNIVFCHLGDFDKKEIGSEAMEFIGDVDVLFAPANPNITKVINQIGPKVIISMSKEEKDLIGFLKDVGVDKTNSLDKFSFKKKDIADKKGEIIALKSSIN